MKHVYMEVQTYPCFGACPIYKIQVLPGGEMLKEAIRFNKDSGSFKGQLSEEAHRELATMYHNAKWTEYEGSYKSGYTDLALTTLRYSEEPGDTFKVTFELEAAPSELKDIALHMDSLRRRAEWKSTMNY